MVKKGIRRRHRGLPISRSRTARGLGCRLLRLSRAGYGLWWGERLRVRDGGFHLFRGEKWGVLENCWEFGKSYKPFFSSTFFLQMLTAHSRIQSSLDFFSVEVSSLVNCADVMMLPFVVTYLREEETKLINAKASLVWWSWRLIGMQISLIDTFEASADKSTSEKFDVTLAARFQSQLTALNYPRVQLTSRQDSSAWEKRERLSKLAQRTRRVADRSGCQCVVARLVRPLFLAGSTTRVRGLILPAR